MRAIWVGLVVALVFGSVLSGPLAAQSEGGNRVQEALEAGSGTELSPPSITLDIWDMLDEGERAEVKAALVGYYRYQRTGFDHRRAVFDWQLMSSRVIFAVVISLVGVGVYFSWIQFTADRRKLDNDDPADDPSAVTTFEAGSGGVKVSSPVLGIIILVISLAFFYLYLVHVYPIIELF